MNELEKTGPVMDPLEPRLLLDGEFASYELGTLGGDHSWAYGINDVGQIVGSAEVGRTDAQGYDINRAFLWTDGAGMQDLGTLGGYSSWAYAVNNRGQVVGHSETGRYDSYGTPVVHAFLWEAATGMVDLGTLGGLASGAVDINEQGQIVGWSQIRSGWNRAFLYSPGDGMVSLGTFSGTGDSIARGINEDGIIVGEADTGYTDASGRIVHAFIYSAATGLYDLDTLGGDWSSASDLNDLAEVVGWAEAVEAGKASFVEHAFLDTPEGMVDVSPYDGVSAAYAINNLSEIVADVSVGGQAPRPYVSYDDGSLIWLDDFGLDEVHDINQPGQIVGAGLVGSDTRAMLLDPVRPWVTIDGAEVFEGDDGTYSVTLTLELSTAFQQAVTLSYATIGDSAVAGEDYQPADNLVTFAAGETSRTVTLIVYGDTTYESDEVFHLAVWSEDGDVTGARATVMLVNDDPPPAPDLQLDLTSSGLLAMAVPGDSGRAEFWLTNVGDGDALGQADIRIYFSSDFVLDEATDVLIGSKSGFTIDLVPGESRLARVDVAVPTTLTSGEYFLLAVADPIGLDDTNGENDLVGEVDAYDVAWRFGTFGTRRKVKLSITDPVSGQRVLFKLSGDGYGQLDSAFMDQITLTGTTARSSVLIKAYGDGVSVGDVDVQGAIKTIKAANVDLAGDLSVQGTLAKLIMGDVIGVGANQTISIGQAGVASAIRLDRVRDLNFLAAGELKLFDVAQWIDADGNDSLTAGAIAKILSRTRAGGTGDWQADVTLNDPTQAYSFKVAKIVGNLTQSDWRLRSGAKKFVVVGSMIDSRVQSAGDIRKVVVGQLIDSDILSGVDLGFAERHIDDALDLVDPLAKISAVVVKGRGAGPAVQNSNVSAGQLGKVVYPTIDTQAAEPFGLWIADSAADDEIRKFVGQPLNSERIVWRGQDRDGLFPDTNDLVVELV